MLRIALSWRWLWRHVLLVVLLALFAVLGHWQWDVSRSSTGDLQNTLYALQWWSFGVVGAYGWWRLLREEAHAGGIAPAAAAGVFEAGTPTPAAPLPQEEEWVALTLRRHGLRPPPEDATEAERASYREHLAGLYARDMAQRTSR